jgi:membrane protein implicated in regulation of membrane protease activity
MTYWMWLALGLALAAVETITQSFVLIWFGVAAIVVGVAAWLMPGLEPATQYVTFGALAMLLLVPAWIIRARIREHAHGRGIRQELINDRAAQHMGRTLVLSEPIAHGQGRAFIGDTLWQLMGADLEAGRAVRVVGTEGMTLKVEAA